MKTGVRSALVAAIVSSVMATAGAANAAYIASFNRTTNDGVYSLSDAQADYLGVTCTNDCFIGYFRVREGNGTVINDGDTFDQASIFGSVTSGSASILGLFNGLGVSPDIEYASATPFASLGLTTLHAKSIPAAVAFVFDSSAGNIVFKGSSTFNASQSRGADPNVPIGAIPEPSTWALLIGGFGLAGAALRRRRSAVAA